ncbi:MAG: phytanoyl-CoA dioxygenase family protein [Lentisphaeria bacterium]|nr:phytanoyl-CoA dioxygenase family protein [Lentisphaeria bacterium]NQZ67609.1 phytanoyl-CoA dioxygenase family protein [Lentisphaeria bacterium]
MATETNVEMNRVNPETPRQEVVDLMRKDGYVLMKNALDADSLAKLKEAYAKEEAAVPHEEGALRMEVPMILGKGDAFENLMDWPVTFPIARDLIGEDISLATGGELDHKYPHSKAYIGWHNDFQWMKDMAYPLPNFWVRCTFFVDDITQDMGPFTLLPGSHRSDHACPYDMGNKYVEGEIGITGKAGDCLINCTEIWHKNTDNVSDKHRRMVMVLYKHIWMKEWEDGSGVCPKQKARQTDPIRKQLVGDIQWHCTKEFPAKDV